MKHIISILFFIIPIFCLSQDKAKKEKQFKTSAYWKEQQQLALKNAPQAVQAKINSKNLDLKLKKKSFTTGYTSVYGAQLKNITGLTPITNTADIPLPPERFRALDLQTNCFVLNCRPTDARVDMREFGIVTDVRNQGNCGSCAIFSVVAALETSILLKNGGDAALLDLSEAQVMKCFSGFSCGPNMPPAPAGYVVDNHIIDENSWRYEDRDMNRCSEFRANTSPYKARKWGYVSTTVFDPKPSHQSIKEAICTYGSVVSYMQTSPDFLIYASGVYDMNDHAGIHPDHAVQIIGWDDALQAWLIKNSWDKGWGEGGFGWIKYNTNLIGGYATYIEAEYTSDPPPCAVITTATSTNNQGADNSYNAIVNAFPWSNIVRLRNVQNSNVMEVDDPVTGPEKGKRVQQWSGHGQLAFGTDGNNQEWFFILSGKMNDKPVFRILNNGFMKFLTDNGLGNPVAEFGNGNNNQLWYIEIVSNSPTKIMLKNVASLKFIEITAGNNQDGVAYRMAERTNNANQQFITSALSISRYQFTLKFPGDVYFLPAHATDKALERPGGNLYNGTELQIWTKMSGNGNQLWKIEHDANMNAYFIKPSNNTGKTIEVLSFAKENGGKAGIWDKWEGDNYNQRWMILPVVRKSDRYVIINMNSGKFLDVSGAGRTNGTKVHQWEYVNADNQEWLIQKAN